MSVNETLAAGPARELALRQPHGAQPRTGGKAGIIRLGMISLAMSAMGGTAGRQHDVRVPNVSWDQIRPYVRAHVVAEFRDGALEVYVCAGRVDRTAVTPYDDVLGDLTKVLLFQALLESPEVQRAVSASSDHVRAWAKTATAAQRREVGEVLREEPGSSNLLPELRGRFTRAEKKGRIRCRVCEEEPSFRPRGMIEGR